MKLSIPTQLKAVLVMIAIFSFAISYNNLHAMAIEMGIPYYLAWFFPLCIDLFLIACSIFILYAEEKCIKESKEGWIFLLSYTVLSIWYNVLHSPPEFWYQVGFAICPISLCVSLHLFIKVVKHEMGGCPVPVAPTEKEDSPIDTPQFVNCKCHEDSSPLQPYHECVVENDSPSCDLSSVTVELEPEPVLTENQMKVYEVFMNNPTITNMAEISRMTGLSYKTIVKHKKTLEGMGMIS